MRPSWPLAGIFLPAVLLPASIGILGGLAWSARAARITARTGGLRRQAG